MVLMSDATWVRTKDVGWGITVWQKGKIINQPNQQTMLNKSFFSSVCPQVCHIPIAAVCGATDIRCDMGTDQGKILIKKEQYHQNNFSRMLERRYVYA